jgi:hypothetical protein
MRHCQLNIKIIRSTAFFRNCISACSVTLKASSDSFGHLPEPAPGSKRWLLPRISRRTPGGARYATCQLGYTNHNSSFSGRIAVHLDAGCISPVQEMSDCGRRQRSQISEYPTRFISFQHPRPKPYRKSTV